MDKIFDGFEYYGAWFKKINIIFAGVGVCLSGDAVDEVGFQGIAL